VVTSAAHADADQAFAAGFLEGYLTAERIMDHHHNLYAYFTGTLNVSLAKPMAWCGDGAGTGAALGSARAAAGRRHGTL
jgi:hypothetical protein